MAKKFHGAVRAVLRRFGLDIVRDVDPARQPLAADIDPQAAATIREVAPYTMTSPERLYALIQGVRYLARAGVPGSIVECGVWRGGSMMAAARTLLECGDGARDLYLYDTYEGMPPPGAKDVDLDGHSAASLLRTQDKDDPGSAWCYATIDDVRRTLSGMRYDASRVHLVQGRVEDTIPGHAPECIALLRLDTDWYESTRHELEHLYPRLCPRGVLIIDDYGHWAGCRQAVDEYFSSRSIHLLLNRIDYTGRIALKPA
ncbi:MAG: TylF/MycF family methyltransferase [Betaproteobacteria bacterium]|nr:TylF/MycF family methyltransferase [Betaproteobacteria bacterium]